MLLFCLSGCASQPTAAQYQKDLSGWLGKPEEELYAVWGYPNTTYSVGEDAYIATYIRVSHEPIDDDKQPYADNLSYDAMEVPAYGLPTSQGIYYCKTSFVITEGEVTDYNFNGDDCVR
jgi:hypothetical protein